MACLSCPLFPSSPPIRLLYYLADVYQWHEIISKPKPCDPSSSCPQKQPVMHGSISVKVLQNVSEHTHLGTGCFTRHLKNHLHFSHSSNPLTGLLLHQCRDISKARMSIGSFPFCQRCCRVCNGGGRSVP